MNSLLRNLMKLLSAIVVVLTVLSYVSPLVNPARFSWFAFFGTAFPWLVIFNLLLMVLWLWRMHRFALYHIGILLCGWQYFTAFFGVDFGKDSVPESAITI